MQDALHLCSQAAAIPVIFGDLRIAMFTNPFLFSDSLYWNLGALSIPITILWIVAITNAVNLIDGLDGLAVGVSSIASMTMLAVALFIGETEPADFSGGCGLRKHERSRKKNAYRAAVCQRHHWRD